MHQHQFNFKTFLVEHEPTINIEKEYYFINVIKAIGVVLVVLGHYSHQPFDTLPPYTYHMPLFFFIGGYLFRSGIGFYDFLKRKFIYPIIYIIIIYIIIGLINDFVIVKITKHNNYSLISKGIIENIYYAVQSNFHGNPYFKVAWFLFAYIFCLIALKIASIIINFYFGYVRWLYVIIGLISGYIGI